jgi:hypothetical protein
MNIQQGDRVLVNVAPFIGSMSRAKDSIPCEVLAVRGDQIHVRSQEPYRSVSLWVSSQWIDVPSKPKRELALSSR